MIDLTMYYAVVLTAPRPFAVDASGTAPVNHFLRTLERKHEISPAFRRRHAKGPRTNRENRVRGKEAHHDVAKHLAQEICTNPAQARYNVKLFRVALIKV